MVPAAASPTVGGQAVELLQQQLREAESLLLLATSKGEVKTPAAALHPHNTACVCAGGPVPHGWTAR